MQSKFTVGTALHGDSGDSPPKGTALSGDMGTALQKGQPSVGTVGTALHGHNGGQPSKRKIPQISFLRIG